MECSPFPGERQFEEVVGAIGRAGTNFPVVFTTEEALAEWGVWQRIVAAVIGSDGRLLGCVNDNPNLEVHIRRLIQSSNNEAIGRTKTHANLREVIIGGCSWKGSEGLSSVC